MKTRFFLHVIVAVSGASVLAIEILGTRILGPFYGVSLFLWSALITVTLAALSAGYLVGGRWADRTTSFTRLSGIVSAAGIWIAAIPWIQQPVIAMTGPLGLRPAVLGAATILFFVPLALLGAVTPYAIRLSTTAVESVGRTAGRLFALSTLAGVASALVTGFYLIPNLGVFMLTTAVGTLLIFTGAAGFLAHRRAGNLPAPTLVLLLLGLTAVWASPAEAPDPEHGLLAVRQSPYAEIRVFENAEGRHLLIDHGIHSRVDTATWASSLPYTAVMEIPEMYFPRPGRMLLIGLGGGSLVRRYRRDGWEVDAVEIDPEVIATAREYFRLDEYGGIIIEMDGRRYLSTTDKKYDVILIDAFGSSAIPFHLVTTEAFAVARSALKPEGVLAMNLICIGWNDPLVGTVASTLRESFGDVLALPMAEPPDRLGNLILIAGNRAMEDIPEPESNSELDPDWRYSQAYAVRHAWDNRFRPPADGVTPYTDDLNPVDVRSEEIKVADRREISEYFRKLNLDW
ncbi:MAG TPA: fused MFS/spermidine synthase [Bacteroidota bacterium]|nr:fused MFS/spermidine synthase [Bacteroidota bacterium]